MGLLKAIDAKCAKKSSYNKASKAHGGRKQNVRKLQERKRTYCSFQQRHSFD